MRTERAGRLARVLVVCLIAAGAGLIGGCSDDNTTKPPESLAPVTNLSAINDSSGVELLWSASANADDGDFKGYNVYRHTSSLAGVSDSELHNYWLRADTDDPVTVTPELTHFSDESAELGTKYYYSVRAVRGDSYNELSTPVEISTAPREEGPPFTIGELALDTSPSGINLAEQTSVSFLYENKAQIDVYLGTTDENDDETLPLALKSPSQFQDNLPTHDWSDRASRLFNLGSGGQTLWYTSWQAPASNDPGWTDQIALPDNPRGMIIAVESPADTQGHRHYAKIWIKDVLETDPGSREIQVQVAYQPIADFPHFSPPAR